MIGSVAELKKKFGEYSIVIYQNEGGLNIHQLEENVRLVLPTVRMSENNEDKGLIFKVEWDKEKEINFLGSIQFNEFFRNIYNIRKFEDKKDD